MHLFLCVTRTPSSPQTGRLLRDQVYTLNDGRTAPGYGIEDIFVNGGVTAYFTGHEHVLQHAQVLLVSSSSLFKIKNSFLHFVRAPSSGAFSGPSQYSPLTL